MKLIEITEAGGPEVLKVSQGKMPECGENDVLISVKAAGVNRPDIMQREGKYPMPEGVTPVPGLEVAGIVHSIGKNVAHFSVGDRVCALTNGGGYAEFCAVPAGQVLPVPQNLSFTEAAALPETFFTVWANLFSLGKVRKEDVVLIHGGASGIGTTALALCNAMNIKAFSTVGSDDKIPLLQQYGEIINYKTHDFEEEILSRTDGKGVDVILDIVGAAYFNKNLRLLKKDGRLVLIGFMGGRMVKEFDIQELILKRAVVTGSTMRSRDAAEKEEIAQQLIQKVWPLIEAGKCKPVIHQTVKFEDVRQAHTLLDAGTHIGKVILTLE
ncbi:TPA: NAD(P)H-quinone oxidoreductase [Citrobacter koseri]|uniref:NAD(P)H-quinone oxidoreductase n=1 Tax=Citrobacter koseri TaxID=545 RepID=UPI0019090034|nr:NAD(P)H-quinone oxidoreductase [Citrobacter koseri]MBJ8938771.1 NAD(P)H-quinone oxidoreductase [Citrobacter koseri]HEI8856948.1 NAD(P)H-quinone oxidoreductase [Citrobacter koseri]